MTMIMKEISKKEAVKESVKLDQRGHENWR